MKGYVCLTDFDWYTHLFENQPQDEVNFWRPRNTRSFRALSPFEPLLFKLKQSRGGHIVGFGYYLRYDVLSVWDAWYFFGQANGAPSLDQVVGRISKYTPGSSAQHVATSHLIGCILLIAPVFFPRTLWVRPPSDWKKNIVAGARYDLSIGEGKRIWASCLAAAPQVERLGAMARVHAEAALVAADPRREVEQVVRRRLGQGAFRLEVRQAYKQCAVTGEHSLPVLDAAHIKPWSEEGPHTVPNGLLLRADIHRLFDRGYVTVTPDLTFQVSGRLREEFDNGRHYYQMQGQTILLPSNPADHPDRECLDYHHRHIFKAA